MWIAEGARLSLETPAAPAPANVRKPLWECSLLDAGFHRRETLATLPRISLRASNYKDIRGNEALSGNILRWPVGNLVEPWGGGLAYILVYKT